MDEVPGITDEEEEEPEAVAGPHSDVAGIAKPVSDEAERCTRWGCGAAESQRRRTTTTPTCTNKGRSISEADFEYRPQK